MTHGPAKRLVLGSGAIAVLLAACGGSTPSTGSGSTITFAAPVSQTGAFGQAEGLYTFQGYKYCVTTLNSKGGINFGGQAHQVKLVTQDDQSVSATSAQIVDQFNDQGYKLILSPYGSASTLADAPTIERNGQVMVDSNGADTAIFSHGYKSTFGVLSPSSTYVTTIIDALASLSPAPQTVAVIAASDGFSQHAAEQGVKEAQNKNITVLPSPNAYMSSTKVNANVTDVSSALIAIKGSQTPDVIIISAHLNEAVAAVKQASELGVKPKLGFAATVAPPTPAFISALGTKSEGVIGSTQWVPEISASDPLFGNAHQFLTGFTDAFGWSSAQYPYQAADAAAGCEVMALAIEKAGSTDPSKVRTALVGLKADTFYGHIEFDTTGMNTSKPMYAVQVQKAAFVTIYPSNLASSKAVWPANP
ncbi:MAG TPA: amino acid ABC transporter substrate-binding protein [Candidatus Dormibacteraeota bacterium]|nr:amino acid ABC transporter substrate-binding protein [Candidatus Dormibacteraeota bacterium]